MRVLACWADEDGCGHYRICLPAAEAQRQGVHVDLACTLPTRWYQRPDGTSVVDSVDPIHADVVILQRPMHEQLVQAIPLVQAQGVAVVVEIDDDLASLHPGNRAYGLLHPKRSPHINWNHLRAACRLADMVTVSTPALASRYGGHGRVRVIENTIDPAWLDATAPEHDGLVIGWAGTVATHPDDLQATSGGVAQAVYDLDARFHVIGEVDHVKDRLTLRDEPTCTPWVALPDYPHALAGLDIGIVPLADTAFNRAKSWLKGLEMAAVGVPFVASPLPEYARLAADGIGVLAKPRGRDWRRRLIELDDDHHRAEIAQRARQRVADRYTIRRAADAWVDAWQAAITIRHSGVRVAA